MKKKYFVVPKDYNGLAVGRLSHVNRERHGLRVGVISFIRFDEIKEIVYRRSIVSPWAELIVLANGQEFREVGKDRRHMDAIFEGISYMVDKARHRVWHGPETIDTMVAGISGH